MPPTLHGELARAAEREGVSLNQFISNSLASVIGWRNGDRAAGAPAVSSAGEARPRRSNLIVVALIANFVVLAVAGIAAIALLIVAWQS